MKVFFKQSFVLIFSIASAIMIVFYTMKFIQHRFVEIETLKIEDVIAQVFPGYDFDDEISVQINTKNVGCRPGITDSDGLQKKLFVFISTVPGYYYNLKLIAGIDEENRITGISLFNSPGALSPCTVNQYLIDNMPTWGLIKDMGFPDGETVDPELIDQLMQIDYKKEIMIKNLCNGKGILERSLPGLNLINASTAGVFAVKRITGDLKGFLNTVHQITPASIENDMEAK